MFFFRAQDAVFLTEVDRFTITVIRARDDKVFTFNYLQWRCMCLNGSKIGVLGFTCFGTAWRQACFDTGCEILQFDNFRRRIVFVANLFGEGINVKPTTMAGMFKAAKVEVESVDIDDCSKWASDFMNSRNDKTAQEAALSPSNPLLPTSCEGRLCMILCSCRVFVNVIEAYVCVDILTSWYNEVNPLYTEWTVSSNELSIRKNVVSMDFTCW